MRSLAARRSLGGKVLATSLLLVATSFLAQPAAAADYDVIVRDRLSDVRELLDRRQAHRSMLTGRVERLSGRLDGIQADRESALETLADREDLARAHERELDRLMPRLLPRLNHLDRVRKSGARAVAGIASMERRAGIADRTRNRLLASQAASIERMRVASTAVRRLRRVANGMNARHRDIDFRIPLLVASASRLDLRQSRLQRRRDAAIRDLAELTVDIDRLTAEEHRLARTMIARSLEATDHADVAADSLKAILTGARGQGKAAVATADIRGIALRQTQPTPVARPRAGGDASAVLTAIAPGPSRNAVLSAKSETVARLDGWTARRTPWNTLETAPGAAADVAALEADPGLAERDRAARVQGPPLVPTIETIGYNGNGDRPEIAIAALPGQLVAAPRDGRVAFAGDFRSYGLLLIIEHGNGYHTLLWGFSSLDIGFGDAVRTGQIVGSVKDEPSPKLHVELRRNGQPVSPEMWLAASNSGVKG